MADFAYRILASQNSHRSGTWMHRFFLSLLGRHSLPLNRPPPFLAPQCAARSPNAVPFLQCGKEVISGDLDLPATRLKVIFD